MTQCIRFILIAEQFKSWFYQIQDKPKKKQKEQEKKKSNLELFKEELKQQQAEREERHRLKKLGIIPMSAPEMIGSGFEPAPTVREQLENSQLGSALSTGLSSKLSSISYYDSAVDDPHSTNLYVGNLSMKIDEEQLCKIFGEFGPLASIKIMWPRNDEERKRDRNCGFVAYMSRANAEKVCVFVSFLTIFGINLDCGSIEINCLRTFFAKWLINIQHVLLIW